MQILAVLIPALATLSFVPRVAHAERNVLVARLREMRDMPSLISRQGMPDMPGMAHNDHDDHDDLDDHDHSEELAGTPSPPPSASGNDHMHSEAPAKLMINETDISLYHVPTPPSYGTYDLDDPPAAHGRYPGLMGLHAILMSTAFFVALPAGIALRSVTHPLHGLSVFAFYALIVLGLSASALYLKLTPQMYEGEKHSTHGYLVILFAAALTSVDAAAFSVRVLRYAGAVRAGKQSFSAKSLWRVVSRRDELEESVDSHEYAGLLVGQPEQLDLQELAVEVQSMQELDLQHPNADPTQSATQWAYDVDIAAPRRKDGSLFHPPPHLHSSRHMHIVDAHSLRGAHQSDDTLHSSHGTPPERRLAEIAEESVEDERHWVPQKRMSMSIARKIGRVAFATAERLLVFLGYALALTGVVTYTGGCRDSYLNGCLAHIIKASIFWCYGLVTFARYLGSFSSLGWAWNSPSSANRNAVSAEFVECLVIFIYGITNTWMERFGVAPNAPYSTKEVQHISIAVMFWFAGLVGMAVESAHVRRWLSGASASVRDSVVRGPSFNPFPALVIGVTGVAMSAHNQAYVFQVQVHILWGGALAAFAMLRSLTYFFLWVRPASSHEPSRPPTEALASFFLACGGLLFQLSTEELTLAAMRRGHNDQMMFMNVAVAVTCFAFCWTLCIVAFKGWLKLRQHSRKSTSHSVTA